MADVLRFGIAGLRFVSTQIMLANNARLSAVLREHR